jgi:site-specific recombinase XerD
MRRWDRLVDQYLAECETRGLAPGTLANLRAELERWGVWLKRRRPRRALEQIDAQHVIAYLQARMAFRSKATLSHTMSTLRGMGEFLVREGLWASNPLRWLQGPKLDARRRVPRRIGAEAMEGLWAAAAQHRSAYHRQLWTTVLAVLYGTGLRRGELERLDVASWDRPAGVLELDGRKTREPRRLPAPELVARCLEAYLPLRELQLARWGRQGEPALFVNQRGARLAGSAVSHAVARLAARAGLERVTLHAFRHSCASDLLEAGVRVPEVQRLLGHRGLATTVRYLAIADRQRHAAIARHPLNDWLRSEVAA